MVDAELARAAERAAVQTPQREQRRDIVAKPVPAPRAESDEGRRLDQESERRQRDASALRGPVMAVRGARIHNDLHRVVASAEAGPLNLAVSRQELVLCQRHLGGQLVQRREDLIRVLDEAVEGVQPLRPAVVRPGEEGRIAGASPRRRADRLEPDPLRVDVEPARDAAPLSVLRARQHRARAGRGLEQPHSDVKLTGQALRNRDGKRSQRHLAGGPAGSRECRVVVVLELDVARRIGEVDEDPPVLRRWLLDRPPVGNAELTRSGLLHFGNGRTQRDRPGFGRRCFPVEVRRDVVIVERPADADVVQHVLRRLGDVVAILSIHGDAVAVDDLKQRHHRPAQLADQSLIMVGATTDAGEALEEVAVREGPFAAALAAEDAEQLPGIPGNSLLPLHVIPPGEWVVRVEALL